MMLSLWTAASGMIGQQANINTISNNLANVNTTGFKKNRTDFQDLIYQTERMAGTPATPLTTYPTGIQVGHGVRVAATQRDFVQGSLKETGNVSDMAISGEGFFRVTMPNGSYGYTRDGAFTIDSNGQLVTSNGYKVQPPVTLPHDFIHNTLTVSQQGRITVKVPGKQNPVQVGQMRLYRFVNPGGLNAVGQNLFKTTAASGPAIGAQPGQNGVGQIQQKFLEMSNVSVVKAMVNMIVAQRAYEMNSKAIQTTDTMMGIADNLKR